MKSSIESRFLGGSNLYITPLSDIELIHNNSVVAEINGAKFTYNSMFFDRDLSNLGINLQLASFKGCTGNNKIYLHIIKSHAKKRGYMGLILCLFAYFMIHYDIESFCLQPDGFEFVPTETLIQIYEKFGFKKIGVGLMSAKLSDLISQRCGNITEEDEKIVDVLKNYLKLTKKLEVASIDKNIKFELLPLEFDLSNINISSMNKILNQNIRRI